MRLEDVPSAWRERLDASAAEVVELRTSSPLKMVMKPPIYAKTSSTSPGSGAKPCPSSKAMLNHFSNDFLLKEKNKARNRDNPERMNKHDVTVS